jgi:glycosyltransferase involved in cell wall biosynthesis
LQREVGDVVWYEFSLAPEFAEARHEKFGGCVKFLPSSWLHRQLWRAFYLPPMAWRWRKFYRAYATIASYLALMSWPFIKALRKDRPDIFFVQDYASGRFDVLILIARMLRIPLIAFHSGSTIQDHLGRWLRRWTLPKANLLIASSQNEVEILAEHYRVPRESMTVILTPIDTKTHRPLDRTDACRQVSLDSTRRYLLFVGRLDDSVKRVSAIIQAFSELAIKHDDVDLLIIGDGKDAKKLQQRAFDCAPRERIRFLGWVADAEIKTQYYNAAECLILASWREGFPTVVGEAMSCGTLVLSSNVGGVSELVIENQTGWLFSPGDDAALKERLTHVLAHPEIVAPMRAHARSVAEERVSPDGVAAALKECFIAEVGKHEYAHA